MIITNDKLMEILERNLGLPMGDGGIFYIEDPGQKRINKIYFSKNNMQLYKCTADNTDVTVTGNYKLYSLTNTDDYLGALTGVDRGQVKYIQDVGTKYVDKVYIDRPTGKLYRCVTQTSSVNNDANFVENNLNSTDGKLQNLSSVHKFTQGAITVSKQGNTCTLSISATITTQSLLSFKIPDIYRPIFPIPAVIRRQILGHESYQEGSVRITSDGNISPLDVSKIQHIDFFNISWIN